MQFTRQSGILLHPTSFYSKEGIGTLGQSAYTFIDWLFKANQSLWQILPLGPTGYGDSPYASFSTFAGNPLLIDLSLLVQKGWALEKDIKPASYIKKDGPVDFGSVIWWKTPVLVKCASYFLENADKNSIALYKEFCLKNKDWLNNYSAFMSIKQFYDKKAVEEKVNCSMWNEYWPKDLAKCNKDAVAKWTKENSKEIELIKVIQFFFDFQWTSLKKYANDKGIKIIGDIPIFVAADSADVWANQEYFQLDKDGKPLCVAGVPPDYFCSDGQLWGNPLYDWQKMKDSGYKWWILRIKRVLELTDIIRIDHFRGFEAYWSVPYGQKTAINGQWIKGPGIDLFKAIKRKLNNISVIAEDLGVITQEVKDLRDNCDFPGMKVLQFAFSVDEANNNGMVNYFLPHMYETNNCIIYTGTHDNQTLQDWLETSDFKQQELVANYFYAEELTKEKIQTVIKNGSLRKLMIKSVIASNARFAVIPLQDILGVGKEGRMNTPSTTGINWAWRMNKNVLKDKDAQMLAFLSKMYGRNID